MTETEWLTCTDPGTLLQYLQGKGSERKLRLFGCACCQSIREWLTDERSSRFLDLSESFADGLIPESEFRAARGQASEAFRNLDQTVPFKTRYEFAATESVLGLGIPLDLFQLIDRTASVIVTELSSSYFHVACETQTQILLDIFGNPFHPDTFSKSWLSSTVLTLARQVYETRDFSLMPILADALQDADCDDDLLLNHCRNTDQIHVRGCWVLDLLLDKS